ncbi:hypothetical protein ACL598_05260 [Bordetella bronchialis]|uniref:hypothetical protein n=1 Tax=Bordetella bronchialis TaxID=463025 RepID=UPI003D040410
MYTYDPKVLPFTRGTNADHADADVLSVLSKALRNATPANAAAPASATAPKSRQEVRGNCNMQLSTEGAVTQVIHGNHNVQINGGNIVVRVNMHLKR